MPPGEPTKRVEIIDIEDITAEVFFIIVTLDYIFL